jgi:hypothetical protein
VTMVGALRSGVLAGVVAMTLSVVVAGAPAQAHPFGEPQTARISAEGSQVIMRWTSPPDDILVLGGAVGALPARREYVFEMSPDDVPELVGPSDADLITSSPEVADYLADHLTVRQNGQVCEPDVSLDELVEEGALVVFDCANPVEDVEVEITMLTDLHEAYRTVAVGEGGTEPDRWLYTIDDPVQTWTFGAGSGGGVTSGVVWLMSALAVIVLAPAAWLIRRRTQHRRG